MASSQWVRVGWDKIFSNLLLRRELDECAFSPRSHVGAFQFSRIEMHFTITIVSASLVHLLVLAGNVGVVSGIFFPENGDMADMSAPCRRHDTDHVGDIVRFWLVECADMSVSACRLPDMLARVGAMRHTTIN